MPRICLIAVHYRNHAQTQAFLNQIKNWDLDIHIADNSAASNPLQSNLDQVHIHTFADNPGYFGAVQRVWETLPAQDYDYVLVSNTDLVFADDFLSVLQNLQSSAAILGPSIRSEISGKEINPLYTQRPRAARMRLLAKVFRFYLSGALWQLMGWFYAKLRAKTCTTAQKKIYAAHGSLLIVARPYFQAGLDFSYPIFLYGEEIWMAEHCSQKGLEIHFEPSLRASHIEHGSLGIWPSRKVWKAHRDSNDYMLRKFFSHED